MLDLNFETFFAASRTERKLFDLADRYLAGSFPKNCMSYRVDKDKRKILYGFSL